ncbi:MAG: lysophospholipid acyltransferase family protein [Deltaproteobacteria bacterium]|nr:lysophospholipid acyltransferase family protein [Deltaproteobacteria bacterium]
MTLGLGGRLALGLAMTMTWVLAWLPRPLNRALGDLGGLLFYLLFGRRRRIALDNVRRAQEGGWVDRGVPAGRIARKSFQGMGRTALESFALLHRGLGYFRGSLVFEGDEEGLRETVAAARREGRGLVLLTAHAGNWELASAAVPEFLGIGLSVVGRTQGGLSDAILRRVRSLGGGEFIHKDGGARAMLSLLRSGGFLGTLFDQADIVGSGGGRLSFMGRPAMTTLGPERLAARTGAALAPLFCRREGGKNIIEIHKPFAPPADPKDRGWVLTTAQALNDLLADFVRRHPEQWMWSHRRWKMPESRGGDRSAPAAGID